MTAPKPFTDDDLKRLKDRLEIPAGSSGFPLTPFIESKGLALLARLEAAEKCINPFWKGHTKACQNGKNLFGGPSSCLCVMGDLYMAWRRAKGEAQ
jgi:hypothetical protein